MFAAKAAARGLWEKSSGRRARAQMDATNKELYELFMAFNAFGAGQRGAKEAMDGRTFAKFAKDCHLLDRNLTRIEVDLIFARVKLSRQRTISFKLFQEAVRQMAVKKRMKYRDLVEHAAAIGGPESHDVTQVASADQTRFHDDVSTYTGMYGATKHNVTGVAPVSTYRAGHTEREEHAAVMAREKLTRTMRSAKHAAVDGQGLTDRAAWLSASYSVNSPDVAFHSGATTEAAMYESTSFLTESSKTFNARGGALGVHKQYQDPSRMIKHHSRSSQVGGQFQNMGGRNYGGFGADTSMPLYHPTMSTFEGGYKEASRRALLRDGSFSSQPSDRLNAALASGDEEAIQRALDTMPTQEHSHDDGYHGTLTRTGSFMAKKTAFRTRRDVPTGGKAAFVDAYANEIHEDEVRAAYEREAAMHEQKKSNMLRQQMAGYSSAASFGRQIKKNHIKRRKQSGTARACCYPGCTRIHRYADGYCNLHAKQAGRKTAPSAPPASAPELKSTWSAPNLGSSGWKSHNTATSAARERFDSSFDMDRGLQRAASQQAAPPPGAPDLSSSGWKSHNTATSAARERFDSSFDMDRGLQRAASQQAAAPPGAPDLSSSGWKSHNTATSAARERFDSSFDMDRGLQRAASFDQRGRAETLGETW